MFYTILAIVSILILVVIICPKRQQAVVVRLFWFRLCQVSPGFFFLARREKLRENVSYPPPRAVIQGEAQ